MDRKKIRWGVAAWLLPWVVFWVITLVGAGTLTWRLFWVCLTAIYVGAYFMLSRSNIDSPRGLRRATNILLGLAFVQMASLIFLAVRLGVAK